MQPAAKAKAMANQRPSYRDMVTQQRCQAAEKKISQ